jgi:tripartite-type tricarboxylate transporter receptor subunit TctC
MGAFVKLQRRHFMRLATGAAALPAVSRIARAQAYPSRPITMVVPYPPGGATDAIARSLIERMRVTLGQPIIIENVAGAGGTVGVGRAARSAPDGYTLSIGQWNTHVGNGAAYALSYDLLNDLEPVSLIATQPFIFLAKKSMQADDLKSLIAWLKANPDKATQGHAGLGGLSHVAGLLLQKETGTRFQSVPYRGSAPAMQDLVAGHIDILITDVSTALPQVRAGSIKAYAVTDKSRIAAAPDIPTVDEAGLPGFYLAFWHGLWVPKGTPKDVIAKLDAAIVDALADANVMARLAGVGQEIFPRDQQTPEALRSFQRAEIEKWWPVIKAAGVKPE